MTERPVSERTRRRREREAAEAAEAKASFLARSRAADEVDRLGLVALSDLLDAWNAMTPADRRAVAACNGHHHWVACSFGRICTRCCSKNIG